MKMTLKRTLIIGAVLLLLVAGGGILYLRLDPQRRLARHVTKARISMSNAQYGAALREYEQALEVDPRNEIVLTELGEVRLAMEQPDRAVKHFADSIALHPEYVRAWTGLLRARLALGQNEEAIKDGQRMLQQHRDAETLVVYGDALAAVSSFSEALKAYDEASQLAPDKYEPIAHRADLLGRLKRGAEQRQVLQAYAEKESGEGRDRACLQLAEFALNERRAAEALALVDRALEIKPAVDLSIRRAESLVQLGRFADARAVIDDLTAGPATAAVPPAAYKVRAVCLLELGDVQGALRDGQQAARVLTDDPDLALTLARIHQRDGRAMQAQEEANRALTLSPDYVAAQNFLMLMLLDRKQYEQAIAFGRTLIDRPRRNEVALRLMIRAYLAAGRPDDALKDIKPLAASPAAGRVITPLPGNDSELERLQSLKEEERNNATVQFLLSQAYLRSRKLQDCMRCLSRAEELEPGRLEVELSLAQIRLALGQGDSAASALERIVAQHPDHTPARMLLIQVYLQQKAFTKSFSALKPLILTDGLNVYTLSMLLQTHQTDADLREWNAVADDLLKSDQHLRQADAHVLKGLAATLSAEMSREVLAVADHHFKQALILVPGHRIALHQKAINDLRLEQNDSAVALLRNLDATQLAPDAHERLDLAVALLKSQDFNEARAVAFEEYALRRTPETLLALVAVELSSGRGEEATKLLEKAPQAGFEMLALTRLAQADRAGEIFSHLAQSDLFSRNRRERWSLECLDQAQALAPQNLDLAAIRAKALFTAGKNSDEAAEVLDRAVKSDRKRADFAMLLADMRRAQNKHDDAIKLYRQVLEARPGEYRALVMAGTLLMTSGNKQDAADLLMKAIKTAPTDVLSLNNYVWLTAVELNRPQTALPYAEDLTKLAPDNPSALDTAGWVFYLNGKYDEAIGALEYAALLSPESGDIAAHHALALFKAGRNAEAKKEVERARNLKRYVVSEQDLKAATSEISAAN